MKKVQLTNALILALSIVSLPIQSMQIAVQTPTSQAPAPAVEKFNPQDFIAIMIEQPTAPNTAPNTHRDSHDSDHSTDSEKEKHTSGNPSPIIAPREAVNLPPNAQPTKFLQITLDDVKKMRAHYDGEHKEHAAEQTIKDNDLPSRLDSDRTIVPEAPEQFEEIDLKNAANATTGEQLPSCFEQSIDAIEAFMEKYHVNEMLIPIYTISSCMTLASANYIRPEWAKIFSTVDILGTFQGQAMKYSKKRLETVKNKKSKYGFKSNKNLHSFDQDDMNRAPRIPAKNLSRKERALVCLEDSCKDISTFCANHTGDLVSCASLLSSSYGIYKLQAPADYNPPVPVLYMQGIFGLGLVFTSLYARGKNQAAAKLSALQASAAEKWRHMKELIPAALWLRKQSVDHHSKAPAVTQHTIDMTKRELPVAPAITAQQHMIDLSHRALPELPAQPAVPELVINVPAAAAAPEIVEQLSKLQHQAS